MLRLAILTLVASGIIVCAFLLFGMICHDIYVSWREDRAYDAKVQARQAKRQAAQEAWDKHTDGRGRLR